MEIIQTECNNIIILEFQGRLDASAVKECKTLMEDMVNKKKINLVIDLKDVDFIDSTGLGILVSSLRSINKIGGDIKISSLQDRVRSIFELTRLHHIFEIFDDSIIATKSYVI